MFTDFKIFSEVADKTVVHTLRTLLIITSRKNTNSDAHRGVAMLASKATVATQVQLPINVWEHENGINRIPDFSRKIGNLYFYVKCPIDSIKKKINKSMGQTKLIYRLDSLH